MILVIDFFLYIDKLYVQLMFDWKCLQMISKFEKN